MWTTCGILRLEAQICSKLCFGGSESVTRGGGWAVGGVYSPNRYRGHVLYVIAALVIVLGLLLLGITLQRTLRKAARLKSTAARAQADIADRRGLIRARVAALGVALAQRRRIGSEQQVAGVAAQAEGRHR
jgi:hypothetical protein